MIYLNKEDYFEIHFNSMLSNYDRDTLTLLYQPLIGSNAAMLYFSLWSMQKIQKIYDIFSVENQLLKFTGLSLDQIQEGRIKLEGIGLIQTFYRFENNVQYFIFEVFAPKTPVEFFSDYLYKGLLVERIGTKNTQKLASIFIAKEMNKEKYSDISCSFSAAFKDFGSNLDAYNYEIKDKRNAFGRVTKDITSEFDYGSFINQLKVNYQILPNKINEYCGVEIRRIATLYGIDPLSMAAYVASSYKSEDMDSPIDFDLLIKACESDKKLSSFRDKEVNNEAYDFESKQGEKIKIMSSMSSFDYLKMKLGNKSPSPSAISILNELSMRGISSGVINVIIDYVLYVKDGVLNKNYCLAIADTINAKRITSVTDAMNHFYNFSNKKKKGNKEENENKQEETNVSSNEVTKEQLDELDALFE